VPAETILPEIVIESNSPRKAFQDKINDMDDSRDKFLLPKFGATSYNIDQEAIESLPQGKNTPLDKVLLQAPGVSYDSAVSNPDYHVRNEYANVQYRINGIQLPEGVSGLGPVLETGFIGSLNLLDGALPAQYGLRTAGVVDITTKSEFVQGGNLSLYGGSRATVSLHTVLSHRTLHAKRARARKRDADDRPDPRSERAGQVLRLWIDMSRRFQPLDLHHRRIHRQIPDS
jgi:hypothetical protein